MTSKAIRDIDERLATLQAGTLRYEALEAAKRFKNSWVDLGRMLCTVYKEKKFKEWGYLTFEAYCAKEVGIRSATAKKLLLSYYFLEREEPSLLKELTTQNGKKTPARMPSPESVNMLRLLKKRSEVPAEGYEKIRSEVLEEGKEPSLIRQQVQALLQTDEADPEEVEKARAKSAVIRMVGTLKAMRQRLEGANMVPKKILDELAAVTKKLEDLL